MDDDAVLRPELLCGGGGARQNKNTPSQLTTTTRNKPTTTKQQPNNISTLDPEEADFFYVPTYTSCFMYPVNGWADFPFWYSAGGPRIRNMAVMSVLAKRWVQDHFPYWNRRAGADHIFLYSHDEGACWAPNEVTNTSIILTHWGRTDRLPER